MKKTGPWSVLCAVSIGFLVPACNVGYDVESADFAVKKKFGKIKWKNQYDGNDICLKGTSPTGHVMADYCNHQPQFQWKFNKKDKCLENRYYGGKCLTEIWDAVVLSPRNGLETFTNERRRNPNSTPSDKYYWLMENTGEKEKWCLTLDDSDSPPWYMYYRECHEDMHAQKFVMDRGMGF